MVVSGSEQIPSGRILYGEYRAVRGVPKELGGYRVRPPHVAEAEAVLRVDQQPG